MDTIESVLSRLLTTKQVATKFNIHIRDVQYAIKRGYLKAYKVGGYFYLIHEKDLPLEWRSE